MERVSVSYLGLAVCADAQLAESDDAGARIGTQQPMPVGTDLEVTIGETVRRARVTSVSEVRDAGMRVAYFEPGHTPPPRPAPRPEAVSSETPASAAGPTEAVVPSEPAAPSEPAEVKPKRRKKKSE